MKIKKLARINLTEAEEKPELTNSDLDTYDKPVNPEVVITATEEKPESIRNLDATNTDKLVADMAQGAADSGTGINPAQAQKEAEVVQEVTDQLIETPYGTAYPGELKTLLQRCLNTALRNKRSGETSNLAPNVILYGLAGFGKTAIVKEFCREHNINIFECDAKNLDAATIGGIPYPFADSKTGETIQAPIASAYWQNLNKPNTVLFLDELNRSNGRVRGSLLTLINEHNLPTFTKHQDGKVTTTKHYDNILFTVIAINPANDVFEDAEPLDPALVSRTSIVYAVVPDNKEYLTYLTNLYNHLINRSNITPADKAVYEGQLEIAKVLFAPKSGFEWDTADDVRSIFRKQGTKMENFLNYRSFIRTLNNCDGTKADFFESLKWASFEPVKIQMIKNILASYVDKPTKGNSVFTKNTTTVTPTNRTTAQSTDIEKSLNTFFNANGIK